MIVHLNNEWSFYL